MLSSSLSVRITCASTKSGKSKITLVSPVLNLSPSSLNFKIYSPSKAGTTASVVLPAAACTRSTELAKVPVPSVLFECRI